MFLRYCCTFLLFFFSSLFLIPSNLLAAEATFSWLPNTEDTLAGYKIHYGTTSRNYTTVIDVGLPEPVNGRISASVSDLEEDTTYYFAATAYNSEGRESDFSQEVTHVISSGTTVTKIFGDSSDSDYTQTISETYINIDDSVLEGSETVSTWSWSSPSPHKVANTIILKADLQAIPSSATIIEARLYLYQISAYGEEQCINSVHKITGHNPVISETSGQNAASGIPWNPVSDGMTYDNVPLGLADIADASDEVVTDSTSGYRSWLITDMVRDWVTDPTANHGLLVNSQDGMASETGRTYAASENSDPGIRPKLVVTYQVNASSLPPVAGNLSVDTDEDSALTDHLPVESDSTTLQYTVTSQPGHGTLTIEGATGNFTYTPNANFNGTDSFVYTVSDKNGESNPATVNITISPVNDTPTTQAAVLTTEEDTTLTKQLNASDIDGDTLSYQIVSNPIKGTVVVTNTGIFTYTPDADTSGTDSFSFKVNDGKVDSNTATVSITINPVNDTPTVAAVAVMTLEDTVVTGELTAEDIDGDPLNYQIVSNPTRGTAVVTGEGVFTYTPDADTSGTDTFSFKVNDGNVDSDTAIVTITVNPVNDAPTAQDATVTTLEDNVVNGQLPAEDIDGDTLTFLIVSNPNKGTVAVTNEGVFTYTPEANTSGTDSFSFKVNDGNLDSNTAVVTVTITPVNDVPTVQGAAVTTDENTQISGQLTAVDIDGDPLTYQVVSNPTLGTVAVTGEGIFTYTPNANTSGTDSFSFKVNDGSVDSDTAIVTITVNPLDESMQFELGELSVSSEWQTVSLNETFINPVVVAGISSSYNADPGTVRIRNITANSFEIRYQEWDYLDDTHPQETITFMVMEEGHFTLDNNSQVEAACFSTSGASTFQSVDFARSMQITPVIQTSIVSYNEEDTVTGRVKNISTGGFEFMMQEQEINETAHAPETACYIAWEPSQGELSGILYDVAVTEDVVTHNASPVYFNQSFTEIPMLLASMQSTDGPDTATTGISEITFSTAAFFIDEEQSRDNETSHTTETVGYMAFGTYNPLADQDNDGLTTDQENNTYHTDPNLADSDQDGLTDSEEISYWMDQGIDWAADLDNDGLSNILDQDADGDGMTDGAEIAAGFDPADPTSFQSFPVMEAGEVDVDHNRVHVDFTRSFAVPVVIARLAGKNGADPCVIRIDSVTETGFDLWLQEYEYLDTTHTIEQVSYIVIEAGHYTLADGTQLEAGSISVRETSAYDRGVFKSPFNTVPVVIGTVAGVNDPDAVTARLRNVDQTGFDCKLQEEELTKTTHLPETVNYLAWEPSSGVDNGMHFEVGTTGNTVTHEATTVEFTGPFSRTPLVFTDMQTTDGGDTAAMRTLQVSPLDLQVYVEEERSKDSETWHTTEDGGFIAIQAE